jgi:hypothetical protein
MFEFRKGSNKTRASLHAFRYEAGLPVRDGKYELRDVSFRTDCFLGLVDETASVV